MNELVKAPSLPREFTGELTEKQEKALALFWNNDCQNLKDCFVNAGYSTKSVPAAIRACRKEVISLLQMKLLDKTPDAISLLVNVVNGVDLTSLSQHQLRAAQEILDRAGVVKEDLSRVNVEHSGSMGLFLIPAKQQVTSNE